MRGYLFEGGVCCGSGTDQAHCRVRIGPKTATDIHCVATDGMVISMSHKLAATASTAKGTHAFAVKIGETAIAAQKPRTGKQMSKASDMLVEVSPSC